MIRYRVLGPLSVAGREVTAGRDRVVLAMLLLHSDRVLGAAELIDALWDEDPPSTARGQVQTCVSRLRRALPPGAIVTDPAGYRLRCGPDDLDATLFLRLVAQARGENDAELFRQALDLWRGPALTGIDSATVRRAAAVWDERRMAVTEEWVDLELAAGHEVRLLGDLAGLVEQFPLRERLRGQLMTALARSGRQAEALAEFRRAHTMLTEELGLDPGPELVELHRQILGGQAPPVEQPAKAVRCLPRTVGDFTGREAVVQRLTGAIDAADPRRPVIAAVDGMAGSGKTTLALHVASLVGDRFPDAHLYVDLHGHSTEQPLEPGAALVILLRQLGVPAEALPAEGLDRIAWWRSELSRRRVLVVFDNAHSSAQLTDLLPTSAGTLALVTSRRRLTGLDGVHPESLPVLPAEDATTLLARIAGDRVLAEPAATAEVVRRCGGLPLALRLAGARLAHRARWQVSDLVRRLGDAALPELAAEDRSVADAFALSYHQLTEPVRRVFRMLGLHPGGDFDVLGVAALAGVPVGEAQDALDELVDVNLVEEPEPGVFRLHDLLREYAAALAAEVPCEERREALTGVLDLQLHATMATMPAVYREIAERDLGRPRPLRPELPAAVADPAERFERERPHLAAFVEAAAASSRPEYAWWLPRAAWWAMFHKGPGDDMTTLLERALVIVEGNGDRLGVATVANYLASGYSRSGDLGRALELLRLSLRIREELGLRDATIAPLGNIAVIYHYMGRFAESVEASRRARRVAVGTGDLTRDRSLLFYLSVGHLRLGRYAEAAYYNRLQFLLAIERDDETGVITALVYLQRVRRLRGDMSVAAARRCLDLMLRRAQRHRLLPIEADVHTDLARLLRAEGRLAEAMAEHRTAVAIARRTRDPRHEAEFLNEFAATCRLAGDLAQARELYGRVLDLAGAAPAYESARAEAGIAECVVDKDPEQARRRWLAALVAFRRMGVPERFAVERRLEAGAS